MTTAAEHAAEIERDGFTIVRDAIAPELVDRLVAAIDALHAELAVTPAANIFEGLLIIFLAIYFQNRSKSPPSSRYNRWEFQR